MEKASGLKALREFEGIDLGHEKRNRRLKRGRGSGRDETGRELPGVDRQ